MPVPSRRMIGDGKPFLFRPIVVFRFIILRNRVYPIPSLYSAGEWSRTSRIVS